MRASAIPGMLRSCRSRSVAIGHGVARSRGPTICRSMGAGIPKFRIWLTMSAGGKEKVVPGKSCASRARKLRT